ncbi:MAG: HAD-IB family hydrolase [Candidatus Pacebacteria bacterium]|nr:HAD-IB family hydrolase [Candidatus Paceibacterota bacterium]
MVKKKFAVFDIDGTIFRSSLLIEITDALIQAGIFKPRVRKIYEHAFKNWLDRKDSYEKYISAVVKAYMENIKGAEHKKFISVAKKAADFHKNRVYRYTRDLVKDLKRRGYYLLAVSNSPKIILDEFCGTLGFDKVYGRIYDIDKKGKFTGKIVFEDEISDKEKILNRAIKKGNLTLKGSIGVGDTEADIALLKNVENPICFNPNQKLLTYAKRAGWKVVVERKDVVYEF